MQKSEKLFHNLSLLPAQAFAMTLSTFFRSSGVSCATLPTYLHVESVLLSNTLLQRIQYRHVFKPLLRDLTQIIQCQIYFMPLDRTVQM